jgi:hypothetical protein
MFRIVTAAMLLSLAGAAHAGTSFNGTTYQGVGLNGMLNGLSPNGMLNGLNLNGSNGASDSTLESVILIGVELPR